MSEADTTTTQGEQPQGDDQGAGLLADAKPAAEQQPGQQDSAATAVSHLAPDNEPDPAAAKKNERPEFLPEKFWDKDKAAPNLEAMAKSYAELEKAFKAGKHKPPADGKYSLDTVAGKIPEDDPLLAKYSEWAGKYGLSQAAFDELAREVVELAGSSAQEAQISAQQERAALGPKADAIIGGMVQWAQKLVSSGVWSSEDFDEFKVWGGTAQGIRALMKLRESYEGRIPLPEPGGDIGVSDEELHAMVGDPKYLSDPQYRMKVESMFQKRYGQRAAA